MSELVKIRKGVLECLEFQNQCTPFIVFKVKGLLQKHPGEAFTEGTNGTLGAPRRSLPQAPIKTLAHLSPPNLLPKAPGFLHSSGAAFSHLFTHFHLFMFPL